MTARTARRSRLLTFADPIAGPCCSLCELPLTEGRCEDCEPGETTCSACRGPLWLDDERERGNCDACQAEGGCENGCGRLAMEGAPVCLECAEASCPEPRPRAGIRVASRILMRRVS